MEETGVRTPAVQTANEAGLTACEVCLLLNPRGESRCPRCGGRLHPRKPESISRTWALLIAAFILYLPANLLPMTTVVTLGRVQSDTILSGVIYFIQSGSWPIAVVIFIASILVPLLKISVLAYLLVSVQRGSNFRPLDRARLYRVTELVGRWSMLDIFVVTVLVALVNLGALATIQAGPAAPFFAAVVVTTMLAAMSFDPRLIWDRCPGEKSDG